ncbi:alpha/beta fold hydrolase [Evansella cellulosilytica]|uniref:alpha/beta fold hydrolase n=1 Tax=Evansella cellulosilytica TaxID=1413 RepID=UPI0001C27D23|nr:alpha/beta hydrolase [Evansella cellulosilytica]
MPWTKDEGKADIYYEIEGSGPPIVFIHPPGMGHVTFRGQKDGMSDQFTVITLDLRGNGRSGTDERELSMAVVAEDVARVLDDCDIKKAYIVAIQTVVLSYKNLRLTTLKERVESCLSVVFQK